MRCRLGELIVLGMLTAQGVQHAANRFPTVRLVPLTLQGVWESASIVVVGDVKNIRAVGTQKVNGLPWPAPPNMNTIYWCKGDLKIDTVIKGKPPSRDKEFLWGATRRGCDLYSKEQILDQRLTTRVW